MTAIACENISLSYGTDVILDKITFSINEGDKLGIIGVNGAGKTTLINILTGELQPDSGKVYLPKNLKTGYLKQNIDFESDKPVFYALSDRFNYIGSDENSLEQQKGEYKQSRMVKAVHRENKKTDVHNHNLPRNARICIPARRAGVGALLKLRKSAAE